MQEEKDTACVLEEIKNAALSGGLNVIKANENNFKDISFSKFFNDYLASHQNLKLSSIINDSGITRQHAHAIINGDKNGNRDKIIALCFAAGMNLDETNHALIYAKHSALYSKDRRDSYIIYAITKKETGSREYVTATDLSILLDEEGQSPLDIMIMR